MKNIVLLFIFGISFLTSCDKKGGQDGIWDDIIELSIKDVEFGVKADSVLISTKGDWWWVCEITFNDSINAIDSTINLEANSYSIIGDNYVIERRNKNSLFVKLDENKTGKERVLLIGLEAGDYFDHVKITQLAN
ncbi:MAG: hypothetical protein DRI86_03280 [Bacteroidetes bacterium]|nr:MAG: hypothetical protein DRI86_03280 [Bacteroidota bacterium]